MFARACFRRAHSNLRLSSVGILSQCSDEIAYSAGCTENSREPTSGIINGFPLASA